MTETETRPHPAAQDRSLLLIALGIVVLVVLVVVAVLLLGNRRPTAFPAESAEGVVQRYLQAYQQGDYEAAYNFFSSDVRASMSLPEYRQVVRDQGGMYGTDSAPRVSFDRTTGSGERREVHLSVEVFYGDRAGPFDGGGSVSSPRVVSMISDDGAWRIDEQLVGLDPGPYPMPLEG